MSKRPAHSVFIFTGANLRSCNFTGANLEKSDFNGANISGAAFTGANLAKVNLSSAAISETTDFSHAYLVGARFCGLRGEKFAYLGCFHGAIFAVDDQRIDVANADFSQISGLVDGQFACYYKSGVGLPPGVDCISTNRFVEAREAAQAAPVAANASWGDGD